MEFQIGKINFRREEYLKFFFSFQGYTSKYFYRKENYFEGKNIQNFFFSFQGYTSKYFYRKENYFEGENGRGSFEIFKFIVLRINFETRVNIFIARRRMEVSKFKI